MLAAITISILATNDKEVLANHTIIMIATSDIGMIATHYKKQAS